MKTSSQPAAVLMLIVCVFSWGSVFPIAKEVLQEMSGLSLVLWRFAIAVTCLALLVAASRPARASLALWQHLVLALVGAVGIGGFNLGLFVGLAQSSATNGSLIMALSPLITALMAALLARRPLGGWQWLGLALGLIGVGLVLSQGDPARLWRLGIGRGDLILFGAMLAWSGYTLCSQRLGHWLPPLPFTLYTMAAGGLAMVLFGLGQPDLHPWQELWALDAVGRLKVLYIGLFATVLGYLFWVGGVRALGAMRASLFINFVPVFAALVAWGLGQPLGAAQLAGMAVVLAGLLLPRLAERRRGTVG